MASPAIAGKGLLKKTYRPTSKLEVFYTGGRVALSNDGSFVVCPCSEEVKVRRKQELGKNRGRSSVLCSVIGSTYGPFLSGCVNMRIGSH